MRPSIIDVELFSNVLEQISQSNKYNFFKRQSPSPGIIPSQTCCYFFEL
jgi:hypothetical protein